MVDRNTLAKLSGKYGNDIVRGEGRDRRPRPKNDPTQSKEGKEHTCVLLSGRDELEYFLTGGILHMHGPSRMHKNTTYSVAGRLKSGGKVSNAGASSPRLGHDALLVNLPYMITNKAEKSWPRCCMYKVNLTIICH